MDTILRLFDFVDASLGVLLARFGILLLMCCLVIVITAFVLLQISKNKDHVIGFANHFKVCLMWGIIVCVLFLGVIIVLTLRSNGLYYFSKESLSFSFYCGWLLMSPEILIIIGLAICYFLLQSRIVKSIEY